MGCLVWMGLFFIGEFQTQELELKRRKGKAESLKRSVISVTQDFLERRISWVSWHGSLSGCVAGDLFLRDGCL